MTDAIKCKCIKVRQPIGAFYLTVMSAHDVLAISFADIRRIEERDIEAVVGIQRELSDKRVKEIRKYVRNIDASFPTSVILAIDSEDVEFDEKNSTMIIRRDAKVASIIDGQHRIAGLEGFQGTFELPVTIFVDMDLEDKAMTFATINLAHTKVNKSLVYDLYEYTRTRSPEKSAHNIARLLNREEESPFYHRVRILGAATGEPLQFLTQATMVSRLLKYISDDPKADRNAIKSGKKLSLVVGATAEKLMFRNLFVKEKDDIIAASVWNFFDAVAARWPDAWNTDEKGFILNRNQGFAAFMRFLGPVYRKHANQDGLLSSKEASLVMKRVRLKDSDFTSEKYLPGTSGESQLFRDLEGYME